MLFELDTGARIVSLRQIGKLSRAFRVHVHEAADHLQTDFVADY